MVGLPFPGAELRDDAGGVGRRSPQQAEE
jgi:hypothetical protein